MTTIGFIGLGIMGGPMAAHLVKAGFDVVGYNLTRDRVDALIGVGGRGADDVAGAVRDADIVITMVPDSPDVEAVTAGEDGIFANAKAGRALHRHELDQAGRVGAGRRARPAARAAGT